MDVHGNQNTVHETSQLALNLPATTGQSEIQQHTQWSGRTVSILEAFVDEVLDQAGITPKNQLLAAIVDDIFEQAGITIQNKQEAPPQTSRVITHTPSDTPKPQKIDTTVHKLIQKFESAPTSEASSNTLASQETKPQSSSTVSSAKAKFEALVQQTSPVDSKTMLALREMATTGKTTKFEQLMKQTKLGFHKDLRQELQKLSDTLQAQNPNTKEAKFLLQLMASYDSVVNFDYEKHKLSPLETLKISAFALHSLEKSSGAIQYITNEQSGLSRDLVVEKNDHNRSFSILSKKQGELQANGTFKKVTDAVTINLTYSSATKKFESAEAIHDVRGVNKKGQQIDQYEITMEKRFGDNCRTVTHTSKSGEVKTTILQPAYQGDLSKVKPATNGEIASVFSQVGQNLAKMHAEGCYHCDLKAENMLGKIIQLPNGQRQFQARLVDFGTTTDTKNADTKYNRKMHGGYGTAIFTAPEQIAFILNKPGNKSVLSTRERATFPTLNERQKAYAAEDMYAFGCALFEMVVKDEICWGADAHHAVVGEGDGTRDVECCRSTLAMQQATPDILREAAAKLPDAQQSEKALLEICAKLLEPDPTKRMTINEFVSEIAKLDAEDMTEPGSNEVIIDQISNVYEPPEDEDRPSIKKVISSADNSSEATGSTSAYPAGTTVYPAGTTVYPTGTTVYPTGTTVYPSDTINS